MKKLTPSKLSHELFLSDQNRVKKIKISLPFPYPKWIQGHEIDGLLYTSMLFSIGVALGFTLAKTIKD